MVAIRRTSRPGAAELAQVLSLVHAAGDADGTDPLSEQVIGRLARGPEHATDAALHLLAHDDGGAVAYAHLDLADPVLGPVGELCVHPLHRRRGVGRALVLAAVTAAAEHDSLGRLRLWAHGEHPSANALAQSLGFTRVRSLAQMRRRLTANLPEPVLPPGVRLREFRPGEDDDAWLAVNARAFVDLPDQGRWTLADLRARLAEPWFDPAGFLVAQRQADGAMLGFHWTKLHSGRTVEGHLHGPIGEVYVLGVHPAAHGTGLGTALTVAGLRYLRERGMDDVMLYVESTNAPAIRLYERMGFAHWLTHASFARP